MFKPIGECQNFCSIVISSRKHEYLDIKINYNFVKFFVEKRKEIKKSGLFHRKEYIFFLCHLNFIKK